MRRALGPAFVLAGFVASCGGTQPAPPVEVAAPTEVAPTAEETPVEPSAADFDQGKRLELAGGPALGCEARQAGDWVRVRCGELSYFGTPAWRASVDKASSGIQPKVTGGMGQLQLVWRFTEGSKLDASFVWFPHLVRLHSEWPKGSPRPLAVARFFGVPQRSAAELIQAACACPPRLAPGLILKSHGISCASPMIDGDGVDPWEPECLRGLETGCQEFNECLTHEPSGYRECIDDEHATGLGPFTSCHKKCDETRKCPSGFSCEDAYEQNPMGEPPEERPFACFPTDEASSEYYQALNAYLEQHKK
ncbi:MAG: hypothetical protein KC492_21790 [Myxococcales bacterium]|nr:hypothetical protein [Myxococcales bacterium]